MDNMVVKIKFNTLMLPTSKDNTVVEIAKFETAHKDRVKYSFRPKNITLYSEKTLPLGQRITLIETYLNREDVQSDFKDGRVVLFLRVRSNNMHQKHLKTTYEWMWSKLLTFNNASANSAKRCQKWAEKERDIVPYVGM
ncbi:uncharacterized protein LOC114574734 [Exaiptasia diaphana]|uniref:Uncharacterized protein n=1 Tax=Exaiptasia diaphana TaxID=2652724 RepID=A0A913YFW8_EXADI|nr:uncharacterized protein LOC114574734 [Exaiptasia diaphana]